MHKPAKARMPKQPDLQAKARMPEQPDLQAYAFKLKSYSLHCHLKVTMCHRPDLRLASKASKARTMHMPEPDKSRSPESMFAHC